MHAGLHDDLGFDLGGFAGELKRVADEIGDAMIDLRRLVVVRQDDGVALLLHRVDGADIRREERPLDRGHHILDALIKVRGVALDLGVPLQRRCGQGAEFAQGGAPRGQWRGRPPHHRTNGFQDGHHSLHSSPAYQA